MTAPRLARLGHLVLRVRDIDRSLDFYKSVLGLEMQSSYPQIAFLSSPGAGELSHELGLLSIGGDAPAPDPERVGLYHFAWAVGSVEELEAFHCHAIEQQAKIVGYGDHGTSFGIYLNDPDGNEVEVFYELPREQWRDGQGEFHDRFPLPLNLDRVQVGA